MDKGELLSKKWEETVCCMEKEILLQNEVIESQKELVLHLEEKISLLEKQKKELINAGNMLSEECGNLENICMCQQELIEEFRGIFSELPSEP